MWETERQIANFICREGFRGTPTRAIVRELKKGIRNPMGNE